ncbi:MAG: RagB/SusD family nutrient uptake outer membrane protein [Prevotella sp.]|nr:RagB/SusD family nutrient uptake outer membrane protein [Prevotella sp.]
MEKKIFKIKKVGLLGLLGLIGLTQISCSDFLEIKPQNEIIMEQFWTEKADVEGIIAGCYSGLQSSNVVKRMMVWGEFRSENIGIGQNINSDGELEKVLKENIDAKNAYTKWEDFYSIINRCNTVLKYAPEVAAKDPAYTQSELSAHIAEVTALRSLCYFYLIRAFRDVPYSSVAFTDDDMKMDLPATKFDDVLDSLIVSLEGVKSMAVKRYPITERLYQTGRITQDAIHAMLCELYLWKQDYDNCIRYADLVIDAKKAIAEENRTENQRSGTISTNNTEERFNGFPLLSDNSGTNYYGEAYSMLFGSDSYSRQYDQEIIFQLVFDDDPRGNSMIANGAVNDFYGNVDNKIGLVAPSDFLLDDIEKSNSRNIFADKNKDVDARMYENCNSNQKSINKFVTRTVDIDATSTSNVKVTYGSAYTGGQNSSNWIIYRLTDIMLMKAEALTMKLREGVDQATLDYNEPLLDQAFSLINAVNKRSVCETTLTDTLVRGDYQTKNLMTTLVYQERQRELMFEGKRWFDLVRISRREGSTQTLAAAALRKVTTGSTLIANKLVKMDAIYWPYNYEELKVNLNLVQNPAFSSGENDSYQRNY